MNIVLAYGYAQEAVPAYLETELRRHHRVITWGPSRGRPQDLPAAVDAHVDELTAQLPADFSPELFLWVESPTAFLPRGVETLACPTAFYQTAALWHHFWAARYARAFDLVFLNSQRLDVYARAGNARVRPLKNACEAAMLADPDAERPIDIAFLGTVHQVLYPERARLLARLRRLADRHGLELFVANGLYREHLREVYRSSKIVFNSGFMGEGLNMRVFEAMICGAVSLTNNGDAPGVSSYFTDGEHLVLHDETDLEEQVLGLIQDPEQRRRIARQGQEAVLRDHAYTRPVAELLQAVADLGAVPHPTLDPVERELDLAAGCYFLAEPAAARRALERAATLDPAHPELPVLRGMVAAAAQDEDAEDLLVQGLATGSMVARAAYAHWLLEAQRPVEAAAAAEAIAPTDEGAPWPRMYYPHTLDPARMDWWRIGQRDELGADRRLFLKLQRLELLAAAASNTGELVRQEQYHTGLLAHRAQDPVLWHRLGEVASKQGDRERAQYCYRRALDENPLALPTHVNLALAQVGANPEPGELRRGLATLEAMNPMAELAVKLLVYPADHPAMVIGHAKAGEWHAMLGEDEAARAAWARSLELAPEQPTLQRYLAGTLHPPRLAGHREAPRSGPLTSIILLTYNQLPYTVRCLESIFQHTEEPFELIVVDNASSDGTVPYLQGLLDSRPELRVRFNRENRGFAGGCNQALAMATGEYLLLLNNDTVVPPHWLGDMQRALLRPGVGMVGPRSNCITGHQLVEPVPYDSFSLDGFPEFVHQWRAAHAGQVREVARIIGFCMLMKREVVAAVGGLDTGYGIGNFEDDDYCLRVNLAGHKIVVADEVLIHHFGSVTFAGQKIDYRATMETNWRRFKEKWRLPAFLTLEDGYRFSQALEHPFDPATHTHPLYPPSGPARPLADARGFNIVLAETTPEQLVATLEAHVAAFQNGDDVVLHVLAGDRLPALQDTIMTWLADSGRDPEALPDISLHEEPRRMSELPDFLRSAQLVLGSPEVVRGARDMGLPAFPTATAELLATAARLFPTLDWTEPKPRLRDYSQELWLVSRHGDWRPVLPLVLQDPRRSLGLVVRVASDRLEAEHEELQGWLLEHGYDPRRIPDILLWDEAMKSEVALFRMATAWAPSEDAGEQAIALALGIPAIPR